jgi:hypothetical protein
MDGAGDLPQNGEQYDIQIIPVNIQFKDDFHRCGLTDEFLSS